MRWSAQAASMRVYPKEKLGKVSIANDKNWQLKYSDTYKRNWRGCLISLVTAVIEPVEMTIYTISGGFENLNHRKLFFLDSPFTEVQKEGNREVKLENPWNALGIVGARSVLVWRAESNQTRMER